MVSLVVLEKQGFFFLASFVIMPDMMCRHLIKGGKRSLVAALLELKKVLVMQKRPREELENKKPLLKLDLHARESSHHLLITGKKPHDESPSS